MDTLANARINCLMKLLIYEDNKDLREGMAFLFRTQPDIELVGAFPHCNQLEQELPALQPDIILMDIDMPGRSGLEGTRLAKAVLPGTQVVILTVFEDEESVFKAIRNGASGYLLKESTPAEVLDAIQIVHKGGSMLTARIARKVLEYFRPGGPVRKQNYDLSEREKDILGKLVEGHSYKEIAASLFISLDTVRSHIRHIYEKLQVHSKSQAVSKALREGLTD